MVQKEVFLVRGNYKVTLKEVIFTQKMMVKSPQELIMDAFDPKLLFRLWGIDVGLCNY